MEDFLSRYRNLTVLLLVVFAQLIYVAFQVKTNRDERLIRVWAVSSVTPMAGVVEAVRRNTIGFLQDYFILLDVREQNRKLKSDNDKLRMENVYFRNQLSTAEHARALTIFQAQIPSKTAPARVIGNSTVSTAKAVFIDRGSASGVKNEMAVVTPEGIVGKVVAVYPLVSQVLLVTDPTFKVGVESQKGHIHGVLNCGTGKCSVEQIQNEESVETGEWFFTSGEDRIFPKGFPVGTVVSSQPGQGMKDLHLTLSGAPGGAEEVLVVLGGVHKAIPSEAQPQQITRTSLPPPEGAKDAAKTTVRPQTEADKVLQKYQEIGKQQEHVYGGYGSSIPVFNKPAAKPPEPGAEAKQTIAPKLDGQPAQTVTAPSILGSRPGTKPPPARTLTPEAQPNQLPRPVLPLGAPRTKTPPATKENSQAGTPPQ